MLVGVPKEIKDNEYRVGLIPSTVRELTLKGHRVLVEKEAGAGAGLPDEDYLAAGAKIAGGADQVFAEADMIVKVKEPLADERKKLRPGQVLFTYLHLAPDPEQAKDLIESKAICIAYETVTSPSGGLPLLAPMSEVAGRMAVQAGAYYLEKPHGGLGVLLGGVPGVAPARVVILGGGVVGSHACDIALGMGAEVFVLDRSVDVLRALWRQFGRSLNTIFSTRDAVEMPGGTERLDFELEVGAILGRAARSVTPEEAAGYIAGFTVLCDWTARDIQFREMDGRLGPFKGKDFAQTDIADASSTTSRS